MHDLCAETDRNRAGDVNSNNVVYIPDAGSPRCDKTGDFPTTTKENKSRIEKKTTQSRASRFLVLVRMMQSQSPEGSSSIEGM